VLEVAGPEASSLVLLGRQVELQCFGSSTATSKGNLMAINHGMNVEEIEAFGNRLQQHFATRLHGIADEIETVVGQTSTSWAGPDGERFRGWWPAKRGMLRAAADDIHGFGQSALNNAAEQRMASGAESLSSGGGSVGVPAAPGVSTRRSDRLDSMEARHAVLDHEGKWLGAAGPTREFPDAMRLANEWHQELLAGDPTAAEVAGFENYMALIKVANLQRIVVRNAAEHAFEQFAASAEAGAGVMTAAPGLHENGGGMLSERGSLGSAVFAEVLSFGGGQVSSLVSASGVASLDGSGVDLVMGQYSADANASLVHLEGHFRATDSVGFGKPIDLANTQYEVYDGALNIAMSDADRADAFTPITGDGSVLDGALRGTLKVVTGGTAAKALDAMEVVGGGAKAGYHFSSGVKSLQVALSGTDSLFEAANILTVGPNTIER
jgi:uncharacterized protein YukE